MNLLLALFSPLAVLVPTMTLGSGAPEASISVPQQAQGVQPVEPASPPIAEQVRIEQRVIVRIAPPGPTMRRSAVSQFAPVSTPQLREKKIGKCLPVGGIAAVQPEAGGKLLLFMRDRRLIAASLEKACRARDFYSGFYLERSGDGMLCADRDKLHSRAGANCAISKLRQLVPTDDD